jgi:hypothetical protein
MAACSEQLRGYPSEQSQRSQQPNECASVQVHQGSRVLRVASTHHRIPVSDQIPQHFHETPLDTQLWFQLERLGHAQRGRLSDVWVVILQTSIQRFSQVRQNLLCLQGRHGSNGQSPDERVEIGGILHDSKLSID